MKKMRLPDAIDRFTICVLLLCALPACSGIFSDTPAHHPRIARSTKNTYTSNDYIKHLALASLDTPDNKKSIAIINAYAAQKIKKPQRQQLLVIAYKIGGDGDLQYLAAPIFPSGDSDLSEVMNRLAANHSTLHDLRIAEAKIIAPGKITDAVDDAIASQEKRLIETAAALPPLEDARLQLHLIEFFIEQRFRDAAYIVVDNVKQSLSEMPSGPDTVQLSQELERLEIDMRKTMPFAL